jgi:predicted nucleotidyltransferase
VGQATVPAARDGLTGAAAEIFDYLVAHPGITGVFLGGSRSRGTAKSTSDWDIFCVTSDEALTGIRSSIAFELEQTIPDIVFVADMYYLEGWGYMYKILAHSLDKVDLSFISESRLEEMHVRETNVVIFDSTGVLSSAVADADDTGTVSLMRSLESQDRAERVFCMNYYQALLFIARGDWWMSLRYAERLRLNALILGLIHVGIVPEVWFTAEHKAASAPNAEALRRLWLIDDTLESIERAVSQIGALTAPLLRDHALFESATCQAAKQLERMTDGNRR